MPNRTIVKGNIGNAVHSVAPDHIVTTADEIFDENLQQYQSEINRGSLIFTEGVYDVSEKNPTGGPNSDGKFTLEYILSNADTLIPASVRKGGMSIKFVQSSDNKYVQARCMAQTFTTDVTQWQGVDDEPTAGSHNLVESGGVYDALSIVAAKESHDVDKISFNLLGVNAIAVLNGTIKSDGSGFDNVNENYQHSVISVSEGQAIKTNTDIQYFYIFASAYSEPSEALPNGSITKVGERGTGGNTTINVPEGAKYFIFARKQNGNIINFSSFIVDGIPFVNPLRNEVKTNADVIGIVAANELRDVDKICFDLLGVDGIAITDGTIKSDGSGFDNVNSNYQHSVIQVSEGQVIRAVSNINYYYIFASAYTEPSESLPNGSITKVGNRGTGGNGTITVPEGAKYFIFARKNNGNVITFSTFNIDGLPFKNSLRTDVNTNVVTINTNKKAEDDWNIKQDIHIYSELLKARKITLADIPSYEGRIDSSNNKWYMLNSSNTHKVVEVKEGDVVYWTGNNSFTFLSDYQLPVNGASVSYVSKVTSGGLYTKVPSGAKYMVWNILNGGTDQTPIKLTINNIDYLSVVIPKHIVKSFNSDGFTDISDEAFIKQTVCLHHDSFYRTIDSETPWNIGTNYQAANAPEVNIAYVNMNKSNNPNIDDGFRIVDHYLINGNRSVTYDNGIRVMPSAKYVKDELLVEMSYPSLNKKCALAFNIIDGRNYEYIVFSHETDYLGILYYKYIDGNKSGNYLSQAKIVGNSIRFQSNGSHIRIWVDNIMINDFAGSSERQALYESISVDFGKPIGIHIDKQSDYELKFINVFDLRQKYVIDVNRLVEDDKAANGVMSYHGTGHVTNSTITRFLSKSAQRFELIKDEVDVDPVTARIEYAQSYSKRLNNLRRYKVSFDLFLPDSVDEYYNDDTVPETLFQMHDSYIHTDQSNQETVPPIDLYTQYVNGVESFCFDILGTEKGGIINPSQDLINSSVVPMANAVRGKWHHFEIYVKEGYIAEHNPLTIVKMDGQEVVRCTGVNTYDRAIGTYARYGFYKSQWEYENVREACNYDSKVVYIDNFKLEI